MITLPDTLQASSVGRRIELFDLDLTPLGGGVHRRRC